MKNSIIRGSVDKRIFLMQYDGQEVMRHEYWDEDDPNSYVSPSDTMDNGYHITRGYYLELTPLSQITDEDAIEVARLQFPVQPIFKKLDEDLILSDTADFLRSKSYALPWMGISVEQQEELGWIKLKL